MIPLLWGTIVALLLTGCAATLTCPPIDGPARVAVLLDHGSHASLAIENRDGRPVRYSYGDRRWYGENQTGFISGVHALFRRTPAVLSRRELGPGPVRETVEELLRMAVQEGYTFPVAAARADRLLTRLDGIFFRDPALIFRNAVEDIDYAPHPRPYTGWYNSNHMVVEWLDDLGCKSRGSPMFSRWRVLTKSTE